MAIMPALAAWAVVPFSPTLVLVQHRRLAALHPRDHLDGCLWDHHRGLGIEFEICVPRRDALGGADRLLRDRHGFRARRRAHGGAEPEPRPDRRRAAREPRAAQLVLHPALPPVPHVSDLGRCGNQPRAVRRRGRRVGNRRRFPRRVFRHGLRRVLPGRIREHVADLHALLDHVPGRLAFAVSRVLALPRSARHLVAPREDRVRRIDVSSGSARRSRAIATTRSCVSAGRCSFR